MSSRIKRFQRKIAKSKQKILELARKYGITSPSEIELVDPMQKKIIYPCNLGILFCGAFLRRFFNKIEARLELVFDSVFYNIIDLGHHRFSKKMMLKGVKREKYSWKKKDLSEEMHLHPTNKFYQVLIDNRINNRVDMITAVTSLPIYSSSDNNIMFLYGEANLDHKCCIVSSLVLKEQFYKRRRNRKLYEQRIQKEVIHEVGHLILGSEHCNNENCVMKYCLNVEEIDYKYIGLCQDCNNKLEKLRYAYNF